MSYRNIDPRNCQMTLEAKWICFAFSSRSWFGIWVRRILIQFRGRFTGLENRWCSEFTSNFQVYFAICYKVSCFWWKYLQAPSAIVHKTFKLIKTCNGAWTLRPWRQSFLALESSRCKFRNLHYSHHAVLKSWSKNLFLLNSLEAQTSFTKVACCQVLFRRRESSTDHVETSLERSYDAHLMPDDSLKCDNERNAASLYFYLYIYIFLFQFSSYILIIGFCCFCVFCIVNFTRECHMWLS